MWCTQWASETYSSDAGGCIGYCTFWYAIQMNEQFISKLLPLLGCASILTALKRLTAVFNENHLCTIEIQCHVSPHKQQQGRKSIIILKHNWAKRVLPGLHNSLFAQWLQRNKEFCLAGFFSLISLSCPFNILTFPNMFRCPEALSSPCRIQNKMLKMSI